MPPRADGRAAIGAVRPELIGDCLRLFDRGLDSRQIAILLFERECVVAWAIGIGREQRRGQ
jgi:hypothetical protein